MICTVQLKSWDEVIFHDVDATFLNEFDFNSQFQVFFDEYGNLESAIATDEIAAVWLSDEDEDEDDWDE